MNLNVDIVDEFKVWVLDSDRRSVDVVVYLKFVSPEVSKEKHVRPDFLKKLYVFIVLLHNIV